MFSSRTDWNLVPNKLSQLLAEKRKKGEEIIDLTESNPTKCGFPYNISLLQPLSMETSLKYEPDPKGLLSARKKIAEYYSGNGIDVDPGNIFLTASTSEAYSHLFRLLCNPGDSVLVPKPSYPLFDYLCTLNDVTALHYSLRYDGEWSVDVDGLTESLDVSTRAILLVHPNNPTGSYLKPKERDRILDIARTNGLAVIVDEVFSEFSLTDSVKHPISFLGKNPVPTFTLNGISKLLGLPQLKLGWITVTGPDESVRVAVTRLEVILDTFLSVGTPVQHALPILLDSGQIITDRIRGRVRSNYRSLCAMVAAHGSGISIFNAEGGWNAILRLPHIISDDEWAVRLLKYRNVLVHPGHFFEMDQEACILISLLPEESIFLVGIARIAEATGGSHNEPT
jgi:alanine-synthesizing transaminase